MRKFSGLFPNIKGSKQQSNGSTNNRQETCQAAQTWQGPALQFPDTLRQVRQMVHLISRLFLKEEISYICCHCCCRWREQPSNASGAALGFGDVWNSYLGLLCQAAQRLGMVCYWVYHITMNSMIEFWLVVWNINLIIFVHILGMSSSQLTFIFFRGVAQPPTRIHCGPLWDSQNYQPVARHFWAMPTVYAGRRMFTA